MRGGGRFCLRRTVFWFCCAAPTVIRMGELITFPSRQPKPVRARVGPEPLWRTVVGEQLRAQRTDRGERIADVAQRAGMSAQYLSEIERGRKDPSSEMLAAVAGALGLTVHELSRRVTRRFYVISGSPSPSPQPRSHPAPTVRPTGPLCLAA